MIAFIIPSVQREALDVCKSYEFKSHEARCITHKSRFIPRERHLTSHERFQILLCELSIVNMVNACSYRSEYALIHPGA